MRIKLSLEERGLQVVGRFHCPARGTSATIDFIVDTGSSSSFLSWEDALAATVEVEERITHPRPVAGFGGTAQARRIPETCFVYLRSTDASLEQVEMRDGFLVYKQPARKGRPWIPGPAVSLLGRDFLRASKYVLHVDLANDDSYFER